MKKILLSLSLIVGVATVAVGATGAFFSDTETSTGNTFTAGTLNLSLTDATDDGSESETATWVFSNLTPGVSSGVSSLTVTNNGSIAGNLDLSSVAVTNDEGTNVEAETNTTAPGDLGASLLVTLFFDTNTSGTLDGAETAIYTGTLNGIAASYDLDSAIAAGASKTLAMTYSLPSGAGDNDFQGDISGLSFTVELDQTAD